MQEQTRELILHIHRVMTEPTDILKLQRMPAQVLEGKLLDFLGDTICKLDMEDVVIFPSERIAGSSRCTAAMKRDYAEAFQVFIIVEDEVKEPVEEEPSEMPPTDDVEDGSPDIDFDNYDHELTKAIKKGKAKKAKKRFDELKGNMKKDVKKHYKKLIEEL